MNSVRCFQKLSALVCVCLFISMAKSQYDESHLIRVKEPNVNETKLATGYHIKIMTPLDNVINKKTDKDNVKDEFGNISGLNDAAKIPMLYSEEPTAFNLSDSHEHRKFKLKEASDTDTSTELEDSNALIDEEDRKKHLRKSNLVHEEIKEDEDAVSKEYNLPLKYHSADSLHLLFDKYLNENITKPFEINFNFTSIAVKNGKLAPRDYTKKNTSVGRKPKKDFSKNEKYDQLYDLLLPLIDANVTDGKTKHEVKNTTAVDSLTNEKMVDDDDVTSSSVSDEMENSFSDESGQTSLEKVENTFSEAVYDDNDKRSNEQMYIKNWLVSDGKNPSEKFENHKIIESTLPTIVTSLSAGETLSSLAKKELVHPITIEDDEDLSGEKSSEASVLKMIAQLFTHFAVKHDDQEKRFTEKNDNVEDFLKNQIMKSISDLVKRFTDTYDEKHGLKISQLVESFTERYDDHDKKIKLTPYLVKPFTDEYDQYFTEKYGDQVKKIKTLNLVQHFTEKYDDQNNILTSPLVESFTEQYDDHDKHSKSSSHILEHITEENFYNDFKDKAILPLVESFTEKYGKQKNIESTLELVKDITGKEKEKVNNDASDYLDEDSLEIKTTSNPDLIQKTARLFIPLDDWIDVTTNTDSTTIKYTEITGHVNEKKQNYIYETSAQDNTNEIEDNEDNYDDSTNIDDTTKVADLVTDNLKHVTERYRDRLDIYENIAIKNRARKLFPKTTEYSRANNINAHLMELAMKQYSSNVAKNYLEKIRKERMKMANQTLKTELAKPMSRNTMMNEPVTSRTISIKSPYGRKSSKGGLLIRKTQNNIVKYKISKKQAVTKVHKEMPMLPIVIPDKKKTYNDRFTRKQKRYENNKNTISARSKLARKILVPQKIRKQSILSTRNRNNEHNIYVGNKENELTKHKNDDQQITPNKLFTVRPAHQIVRKKSVLSTNNKNNEHEINTQNKLAEHKESQITKHNANQIVSQKKLTSVRQNYNTTSKVNKPQSFQLQSRTDGDLNKKHIKNNNYVNGQNKLITVIPVVDNANKRSVSTTKYKKNQHQNAKNKLITVRAAQQKIIKFSDVTSKVNISWPVQRQTQKTNDFDTKQVNFRKKLITVKPDIEKRYKYSTLTTKHEMNERQMMVTKDEKSKNTLTTLVLIQHTSYDDNALNIQNENVKPQFAEQKELKLSSPRMKSYDVSNIIANHVNVTHGLKESKTKVFKSGKATHDDLPTFNKENLRTATTIVKNSPNPIKNSLNRMNITSGTLIPNIQKRTTVEYLKSMADGNRVTDSDLTPKMQTTIIYPNDLILNPLQKADRVKDGIVLIETHPFTTPLIDQNNHGKLMKNMTLKSTETNYVTQMAVTSVATNDVLSTPENFDGSNVFEIKTYIAKDDEKRFKENADANKSNEDKKLIITNTNMETSLTNIMRNESKIINLTSDIDSMSKDTNVTENAYNENKTEGLVNGNNKLNKLFVTDTDPNEVLNININNDKLNDIGGNKPHKKHNVSSVVGGDVGNMEYQYDVDDSFENKPTSEVTTKAVELSVFNTTPTTDTNNVTTDIKLKNNLNHTHKATYSYRNLLKTILDVLTNTSSFNNHSELDKTWKTERFNTEEEIFKILRRTDTSLGDSMSADGNASANVIPLQTNKSGIETDNERSSLIHKIRIILEQLNKEGYKNIYNDEDAYDEFDTKTATYELNTTGFSYPIAKSVVENNLNKILSEFQGLHNSNNTTREITLDKEPFLNDMYKKAYENVEGVINIVLNKSNAMEETNKKSIDKVNSSFYQTSPISILNRYLNKNETYLKQYEERFADLNHRKHNDIDIENDDGVIQLHKELNTEIVRDDKNQTDVTTEQPENYGMSQTEFFTYVTFDKKSFYEMMQTKPANERTKILTTNDQGLVDAENKAVQVVSDEFSTAFQKKLPIFRKKAIFGSNALFAEIKEKSSAYRKQHVSENDISDNDAQDIGNPKETENIDIINNTGNRDEIIANFLLSNKTVYDVVKDSPVQNNNTFMEGIAYTTTEVLKLKTDSNNVEKAFSNSENISEPKKNCASPKMIIVKSTEVFNIKTSMNHIVLPRHEVKKLHNNVTPSNIMIEETVPPKSTRWTNEDYVDIEFTKFDHTTVTEPIHAFTINKLNLDKTPKINKISKETNSKTSQESSETISVSKNNTIADNNNMPYVITINYEKVPPESTTMTNDDYIDIQFTKLYRIKVKPTSVVTTNKLKIDTALKEESNVNNISNNDKIIFLKPEQETVDFKRDEAIANITGKNMANFEDPRIVEILQQLLTGLTLKEKFKIADISNMYVNKKQRHKEYIYNNPYVNDEPLNFTEGSGTNSKTTTTQDPVLHSTLDPEFRLQYFGYPFLESSLQKTLLSRPEDVGFTADDNIDNKYLKHANESMVEAKQSLKLTNRTAINENGNNANLWNRGYWHNISLDVNRANSDKKVEFTATTASTVPVVMDKLPKSSAAKIWKEAKSSAAVLLQKENDDDDAISHAENIESISQFNDDTTLPANNVDFNSYSNDESTPIADYIETISQFIDKELNGTDDLLENRNTLLQQELYSSPENNDRVKAGSIDSESVLIEQTNKVDNDNYGAANLFPEETNQSYSEPGTTTNEEAYTKTTMPTPIAQIQKLPVYKQYWKHLLKSKHTAASSTESTPNYLHAQLLAPMSQLYPTANLHKFLNSKSYKELLRDQSDSKPIAMTVDHKKEAVKIDNHDNQMFIFKLFRPSAEVMKDNEIVYEASEATNWNEKAKKNIEIAKEDLVKNYLQEPVTKSINDIKIKKDIFQIKATDLKDKQVISQLYKKPVNYVTETIKMSKTLAESNTTLPVNKENTNDIKTPTDVRYKDDIVNKNKNNCRDNITYADKYKVSLEAKIINETYQVQGQESKLAYPKELAKSSYNQYYDLSFFENYRKGSSLFSKTRGRLMKFKNRYVPKVNSNRQGYGRTSSSRKNKRRLHFVF